MPKDVAKPDEIANRAGDGAAALARLLAPVHGLDGVGPRAGVLLARLVGAPPDAEARLLDLLWHLPQGVIDRRLHEGPAGLLEGARVTLSVRVQQHQPGGGRPPGRFRRGRPYKVRCWSQDGFVHLVFFQGREAYLRAALPEGEPRIVSGTLGRFGNEWQIVHPEVIALPEEHARTGPFQPVYPLTQGLGQGRLGRYIGLALEQLPELPEWQDPAWLERHGWPSFAGALRRLHRPGAAGDLQPDQPPRRRLAYDEILASQLALGLLRARGGPGAGRRVRGDGRLRAAVMHALPFRLTGAQRQALAEIDTDMTNPARMLRLLQGDVGSGKTLVALLAMLAAVEAGAQAVLMAPTEVLARQHHRTIAHLLEPVGLVPALLTGRERGEKRRELLAGLASGAIRIALGTHALFQETVELADLALAVIDEQHRFGVDQRLELAAKGTSPDLLVMTATPIPRTLVLALYGDMAVSELREKPPGRQPIRTRVMPLERLEEIVAAVRRALERGEQLYWVCPQIAAAEDTDLAAAEARHAMLRAHFGAAVGLVHGRMPAADKDRAMQGFAAGRVRLLVATTVIEVGIDVPAAGVIVIEHAERFGLAQLHQLRGRVGRGTRPSTCLLLYAEPLGEVARARLEVLRATDDGFRIAEEDLRLRGPGEVLGTRQSGLPALRLADLGVHADLLAPARDDARRILRQDPQLGSPRGQALRGLLRLFEREQTFTYLGSG